DKREFGNGKQSTRNGYDKNGNVNLEYMPKAKEKIDVVHKDGTTTDNDKRKNDNGSGNGKSGSKKPSGRWNVDKDLMDSVRRSADEYAIFATINEADMEENTDNNEMDEKPEFIGVVKKGWELEVRGCHMYKLVKRLKSLKPHLKNLSWKNGNLYDRVIKWKGELQKIQTSVDGNPHDAELKKEEARIMKEYYSAVQDEKSFLFQEALNLYDAESIDCLPNEETFAELARMGTAWNEFSSSMASAVICLATGRKFKFSKYIFDNLVRNVDSSLKFYMVGKGFPGVETPLFEGMLAPQQADDDVANVATDDTNDVADVDAEPTLPSPTPITTPPPQQDLPSTSQLVSTPPPSPIAQPSSPPQQQQPSQPTTISMDLLHTLLETYTALTKRVGTAQRIESYVDTVMDDQEDASKRGGGGIIALIYADEDVILEEVDVAKDADDDEPEPTELKEVIKVVTTTKLMTKVVTAVATTITAAPIAAATITTTPSMSYDAIRPIFKKYFNSNVAFLEKSEQELEEKASRALKRTSKSSKEKAAKKQKLDEEVEELKKHLQIVPNNDNDVYTEATPLALKVYVVDYQIYTENNKPYYKIIRANGTHQLFLSFLSLLRNFHREDLEVLWQIVQDRFASSKPKNFLNDFLLTTLKSMFEKPNVEDHIWKNQSGIHGLAKVNS
nr:RNA-directed DNA polymerase, eukaryota, reverse transcriptase zinc-binding domain protein [Tanacetum cinerariifolium]